MEKNCRNLSYVKAIVVGIEKRFVNGVATLNMNDGDVLLIQQNADGYTMYNGCELIVGDTSLKFIAMCIADGDYKQ